MFSCLPDCPPTFAPYRGKCYRVDLVQFHRDEAAQICKNMGEAWVGGGQLAEPRDPDITVFLTGIKYR